MQGVENNVVVVRKESLPSVVLSIVKLVNELDVPLETTTLAVSASKRLHTLPECCGEFPTNIINFPLLSIFLLATVFV